MLHQNQEKSAENFKFEATVCIITRLFVLLIEGMSNTIYYLHHVRFFVILTEGLGDTILCIV